MTSVEEKKITDAYVSLCVNYFEKKLKKKRKRIADFIYRGFVEMEKAGMIYTGKEKELAKPQEPK